MSLAALDLGTGVDVTGSNTPFARVGRRNRAILYALRGDFGNQGDKYSIAAPSVAGVSGPDDASGDAIEETDTQVGEHAARGVTYILEDAAYQLLCAVVQRMQLERPWDERLITYRWNRRTFVQTQRDLAEPVRVGVTHYCPTSVFALSAISG